MSHSPIDLTFPSPDRKKAARPLSLAYDQSLLLSYAQTSSPDCPPRSHVRRPQSMLLPSNIALDEQIFEKSDGSIERRPRVDSLDSLKKIRAQNAILSRSLREYQEKCLSLMDTVEAERKHRQHLEVELKRISHLNFTLLEHNKLLVGRDSALQEDISTLINKSQADDWMRNVLEDELRLARINSPQSPQPSPSPDPQRHSSDLDFSAKDESLKRRSMALTLEHSGPLRSQLVATRDELHITQRQLDDSEKRCAELTAKVSALQLNMTQCVDSSAQALEVERELRSEVVERATALEEENISLKSTVTALRQELDKFAQASVEEKVPPVRPKANLDDGAKGHLKISKLNLGKNKYILSPKTSGCPPTIARPFNTSSSRASSFDLPETPDSSSTLISSPPSSRHTPHTSKDKSYRFFRPLSLAPDRNTLPLGLPSLVHDSRLTPPPPPATGLPRSPSSTLLAATLSRQPSTFQFPGPSFKSSSTLFIDVKGAGHDVQDNRGIVDYVTDSKLRRASAVLSSIARSYSDSDEWIRV